VWGFRQRQLERQAATVTDLPGQRLGADFYASPTCAVAEQLLGKLLVRERDGQRLSGIVVEVEAYLSAGDPASHSHRGASPRNAAMFCHPGTLYVYTIHARYCLNVVTEPPGRGAAVLIRAVEPWEGVAVMQRLRGKQAPRELTTGPARLCQALDITTDQNGLDLVRSHDVWLEAAPAALVGRRRRIVRAVRIGISQAVDLPLRYFLDGHRLVSGLARHHSAGRSWTFAEG
jgi:DNA-3-methyladenine glycosylase